METITISPTQKKLLVALTGVLKLIRSGFRVLDDANYIGAYSRIWDYLSVREKRELVEIENTFLGFKNSYIDDKGMHQAEGDMKKAMLKQGDGFFSENFTKEFSDLLAKEEKFETFELGKPGEIICHLSTGKDITLPTMQN
jgi:hypothetical protein